LSNIKQENIDKIQADIVIRRSGVRIYHNKSNLKKSRADFSDAPASFLKKIPKHLKNSIPAATLI
jgi:hypothetical protein